MKRPTIWGLSNSHLIKDLDIHRYCAASGRGGSLRENAAGHGEKWVRSLSES